MTTDPMMPTAGIAPDWARVFHIVSGEALRRRRAQMIMRNTDRNIAC
jgi:hypothetical protein